MKTDALQSAARAVQQRWPDIRPRAGLILGSGWGSVAETFELRDAIAYDAIPALGATGVEGHAGRLHWARLQGADLLIFQGRRHFYEGMGWTPVAVPVFLLKTLGAGVLVLTNAAGGMREDFRPGDLMVVRDHMNWMGDNPLVGAHDPFWGPRFPDQSEVYARPLRSLWHSAALRAGVVLHSGLYAAVRGPVFETPAEVRALRALGADAVGMSTVPEAMLAHAAGLRVAGLSCITNRAAGLSPEPLSHDDVTQAAVAALPAMRSLLPAFLELTLASGHR